MDLKERGRKIKEGMKDKFSDKRGMVGPVLILVVPFALPVVFVAGVVMLIYVRFVPDRIQFQISNVVTMGVIEGKFFFLARHERRRFRAFMRQTGIPRSHRKYWEAVHVSRLRIRYLASAGFAEPSAYSDATDELVSRVKIGPLRRHVR